MAKRIDPLAPLSDKYLRKQARQDIQAQIAPLAALINKRAESGASNIAGVANQLASDLAPFQQKTHDIYAGADANLGAIDNQLADRLGAGDLAGDLKARLTAAGQSPQLADALLAASHGASGAGFAKGAADRQMLTTQGAGAEDFASKLPAFAKLGGLQGVKFREAQAQSDLGDLLSKTPGMVASALSDSRNREFQKGATRLTFLGDQYTADLRHQDQVMSNNTKLKAIAAANARTGMTLAERARHNRVSESEQSRRDQEAQRHHKTQESQATVNAREKKRHDRASEKNSAKSAASLGAIYGK